MLDARFDAHNLHRINEATFLAYDPHLRRLAAQPLVFHSHLLARLPFGCDGIFTLSGGRQVGKTTLLKQWMAKLLTRGVPAERIAYLTGELIDDHHALVRVIQESLQENPPGSPFILIVDEVTYIRDWDRGIKFLADAGVLEGVALLVTGSDMVVIRDARARLPGRRGRSGVVDFHLFPLNFREASLLTGAVSNAESIELDAHPSSLSDDCTDRLFQAFQDYLLHGGFPSAMNDLRRDGRIAPATYRTYSDWIRGDVLKRGKSERYLREVLGAIRDRLGSQVTWNALAADLSIDHPATVADYVELLSSMDAVFVQPALVEHKLVAAPKKARKVMFSDPFIHHAVNAWLADEREPFDRVRTRLESDPGWTSRLVESCVTTQFRQVAQTLYIKGRGEVDLAVMRAGGFEPIEVKWSGQIRPKDVAEVARFPNGRILARSRRYGEVHGVPTEPLPVALFRLFGGT